MFRSVDLYNKSTSAIRSTWREFVKHIQQYVEHNRVVSGEGAATLPIGTIVHSSDDGEVTRAVDIWSGVLCQPAAPGEEAIIRTDGLAKVRFIDELVLTEGVPVYVSATPGSADIAGTERLGILADADDYDGNPASPTYNPYANVCLGYICEPEEVI